MLDGAPERLARLFHRHDGVGEGGRLLGPGDRRNLGALQVHGLHQRRLDVGRLDLVETREATVGSRPGREQGVGGHGGGSFRERSRPGSATRPAADALVRKVRLSIPGDDSPADRRFKPGLRWRSRLLAAERNQRVGACRAPRRRQDGEGPGKDEHGRRHAEAQARSRRPSRPRWRQARAPPTIDNTPPTARPAANHHRRLPERALRMRIGSAPRAMRSASSGRREATSCATTPKRPMAPSTSASRANPMNVAVSTRRAGTPREAATTSGIDRTPYTGQVAVEPRHFFAHGGNHVRVGTRAADDDNAASGKATARRTDTRWAERLRRGRGA